MAILTVVSLSWATAVDSVPGNTRPFIGSSAANSVTDLAFGYNGAQRLTGKAADVSPNSGVSDLPNQVSSAGPARLFRVGFGTQISWFLPLALFCIPFVIVRRYRMDKKSRFKSRTGAEILFWIFYFIPAFCIFSYAGFFHRYYFVVMAPPIAALCGIGWTAMNNRFRQLPGLRPVIYPVSLLATVLLQTVYMAYYHLVQGIAFGLTGMMLLAILFLKNRELRLPHRTAIGPSPAAIIILLSALPLYWSMTPALYGGNNVLPEAGPQLEKPNSSIPGASGATNRSLIHYVLSQPPHTFLFGTVNAPAAAPYIIKTGKPVMAIGGFNGTDPIMKPEQLEQLIRQGKIRYFYFPPDAHVTETPIIQWIRTHGREITQKKWAGTQTGYNGQLYDLRSFELAKH
jgi:4-amino-4-deoxy-L-arabinose transferase-like glycosyltransferase